MRIIQAAIVSFSTPFFIYNKDGIKQLPTWVENGSESITSLCVGDTYFEAPTINEVMEEFTRLGFVMPEENTWDFPERQMRATVKDVDMLTILKTYPEMIGLLDILKDFIIQRNGSQVIYLNELYPEHRAILEGNGAIVETKPIN